MVWIFRQPGDGGVGVVDRADDDEGMHLDAASVGLLDQVAERVDGPFAAGIGLAHAGDLREWLESVEVPRVATAPDLGEDGVAVAVDAVLNDAVDVGARAEGGVERLHPVGAIFSARLRRDRKGEDQKSKREREREQAGWHEAAFYRESGRPFGFGVAVFLKRVSSVYRETDRRSARQMSRELMRRMTSSRRVKGTNRRRPSCVWPSMIRRSGPDACLGDRRQLLRPLLFGNPLLHPQVQKRFRRDTMRFCDLAKLVGEISVHRKIHGRRLKLHSELDRLCLVPMVGEIVLVPILTYLPIGLCTGNGGFTFAHIASVPRVSCRGRKPAAPDHRLCERRTPRDIFLPKFAPWPSRDVHLPDGLSRQT